MKKITQWCAAGGLAVAVTLALDGCRLTAIGGPAPAPSAGPAVRITQKAVPSALVMVLNGAPGGGVTNLVTATARLREDLAVLQSGTLPRVVVSATAPSPTTVTVTGRPGGPGEGATSFQEAQFASRLKHWHGEVEAGRRAEAAQMQAALLGWLRGLSLPPRADEVAGPRGAAGGLAGESRAAASALTGLEEENGNVFGQRRVIVLFTSNLTGHPPAGELSGDTVLVVTPQLPSAAAASAAQADLLAAGAARAAVIGPEVTGAQIGALVSAGLSQGAGHDSVSAPVLFANASATLSPHAVSQLAALLPRLSGTGVTAVINGFASVPGTALSNYKLSYDRAAAVASFLEGHGIPAASLIIVGHGSSDLTAAGSSGRNRRVSVVMESP